MIKFGMVNILINNKGNLMKKFNLVLTFTLLTNILVAHCQIPCGIYDDALRILQIKENFQTIEKAMNKIAFLSSELTPQSSQQIVRWVNTKEDYSIVIDEVLKGDFKLEQAKKWFSKINNFPKDSSEEIYRTINSIILNNSKI